MNEPKVEQLALPPQYGKPKKKLEWAAVRKDLEDAPVYWVATTRPDGRPHVVPRDGIWHEDTWYYGGAEVTIHNRNPVAMNAGQEGGWLDHAGYESTQDLPALPLDLLLFPVYEGDDVSHDIQRGDPGISCTRHSLHRGDKQLLDTERAMQWGQCQR